jgi:hypothetical protein
MELNNCFYIAKISLPQRDIFDGLQLAGHLLILPGSFANFKKLNCVLLDPAVPRNVTVSHAIALLTLLGANSRCCATRCHIL